MATPPTDQPISTTVTPPSNQPSANDGGSSSTTTDEPTTQSNPVTDAQLIPTATPPPTAQPRPLPPTPHFSIHVCEGTVAHFSTQPCHSTAAHSSPHPCRNTAAHRPTHLSMTVAPPPSPHCSIHLSHGTVADSSTQRCHSSATHLNMTVASQPTLHCSTHPNTATPTIAQPSTGGHVTEPGSSSNPAEPKWFSHIFKHQNATARRPVMYSAPRHMTLPDRDAFVLDRINTNKIDPVFDPFIVSFGPTGRKTPPSVDGRKNRLVFSMLDRHRNPDKRRFLMELVEAVRTLQPDPRRSYFDIFKDEDFLQIMVIDGCVILEIFRIHRRLSPELAGHSFFRSRWALPTVALETVKVDNQLPYSVLEELYEKTKNPNDPTLKQVAATFLDFMFPRLIKSETIQDNTNHDHLLSLFHSMCKPCHNHTFVTVTGESIRFSSSNSFPSVTDLRFSGIEVVEGGEEKKLLEIVYKNGKLEIPTLVIDHNTKILMRNMIAYEESRKEVENVFTSYATFMGKLVNTAEDVEVLRLAGVINHFLSSNGKASTGLKTCFKRHLSSREGKSYLIAYVAAGLAVVQVLLAILPYVLPPQK